MSKECFFCGRNNDSEIGGERGGIIEEHHIIPESWSKREGFENKTINICRNCHKRLHKITNIFKKDRKKWIEKFKETKEKMDKIVNKNVGFLEGNTVKVSVSEDKILYGNVIEADEDSIKICAINNPNKIEKRMFNSCKVLQQSPRRIYEMAGEKKRELQQVVNILSKRSEDKLKGRYKFWKGWRKIERQLRKLAKAALVYKYIRNNPKCTRDEIIEKVGESAGSGIRILRNQLGLIIMEKIEKEVPTTKKQTIRKYKLNGRIDSGEDKLGEE